MIVRSNYRALSIGGPRLGFVPTSSVVVSLNSIGMFFCCLECKNIAVEGDLKGEQKWVRVFYHPLKHH